MVLWCDWKLATGSVVSGVSWEGFNAVQVSHHLCPGRATWWELQSDLQLVAACAGLGSSWLKSQGYSEN